MPKITVAIPSYNHEKYIAHAIRSVLEQTFQDFEIVITDDGSSDETLQVIREFTDPRIRIYCNEKNCGASAAMNNCIQQAKGEYIAILNSDDLFSPDKLEKQVDFLDKNPEIGAVFGYAQIIDDTKGHTLAQASSNDAKAVGIDIAKKAKTLKIEKVVFDRGGYLYTGKIKAIADSAREGGLNF